MLKKQNKNNFSLYIFIGGIILFFISVVFLVVFSIYNFNYQSDREVLAQEVKRLSDGDKVAYGDPLIFDEKARYPKVESDDPTQGDKLAPATIFLFSDFTCEPCKKQQEIIKELLHIYPPDKLRLVWKGVATNPQGVLAQSAAYCAQSQGKFWEFSDKLFSLPIEKFSIQEYEKIAYDLGLKLDEYIKCLSESQTSDKIYINNNLAHDLGIKYLPYFYIDNTPYRGVLSVRQLRGIITLLLGN